MGYIAMIMINTILVGSGAIGSPAFLIGLLIAFILFCIGISRL